MVAPIVDASLKAFLRIRSARRVNGKCPSVIVPPEVLIISSTMARMSSMSQS